MNGFAVNTMGSTGTDLPGACGYAAFMADQTADANRIPSTPAMCVDRKPKSQSCKVDAIRIPDTFDFALFLNRHEARGKLSRHRPVTLRTGWSRQRNYTR
jgi:hypothetical protein